MRLAFFLRVHGPLGRHAGYVPARNSKPTPVVTDAVAAGDVPFACPPSCTLGYNPLGRITSESLQVWW